MYHILRVILYRLWMLSTFTLLSSIIVFWFYGFFVAFAVFTSGISGILYSAQDLLLYYPNDPPDSRIFVLQPSNYKLPYESIKIRNEDGLKIHMFLIKQIENSKGKPTMIFFHGNAGNMGQRLSNVSGFYHKLNINILMVEYRGYGLSEGSPSERGIYVDAQAAFNYIMQRNDIDRTKIFLFGRSLGGAVAIDLASRLEYKNKIWAVVVENTFTSIPDMAKIILKWRCLLWLPLFCHKNKVASNFHWSEWFNISYPGTLTVLPTLGNVKLMLQHHLESLGYPTPHKLTAEYMSLSKIGHVVAPTLVMCGSKDALVPPRMARELYIKCGSVGKKIAVMPGGGHDDTWTCRDYYSSIQQFLANVPPLSDDVIPYYDNNLKDPSITRIVVHTV